MIKVFLISSATEIDLKQSCFRIEVDSLFCILIHRLFVFGG